VLIKPPSDIPSSEITARRTTTPGAPSCVPPQRPPPVRPPPSWPARWCGRRARAARHCPGEPQPVQHLGDAHGVRGDHLLQNFYEFGLDKEDPARYAGTLTTRPWTVRVDGLVRKPADYAIDDLIKASRLEERVYRLRCVEAWSMVIPWVGVRSPR